MPRKAVKREAPQLLRHVASDVVDIDERQPVSSGDTIADSDVTVHEEQVDEGYHSNHANHNGKDAGDHDSSAANGQVIDPDGGIQVLGRGVKELVQAVQALRHLGVEDLDLPLPKIVVVGDQSTGKSSLIEGMSEIKVPRKAGTCTRCPLEINLTESSTGIWTCKVSLFKKYLYEGNLGTSHTHGRGFPKSEAATRARPLGPWTAQDAEDFHFATITSKSEVPDVLYRAQLATLNPGSAYEKYMPEQPASAAKHQVKFSPNIVRLDISGPGLPNLSFYDLPGVINVSDISGEEYLVTLVKNLVKSYVSADDSINLLAIPMTDDPANSSALRLIGEVKAEARTIGCLTKPDRRQEGEALDQWIQILNGERFRLGHGYYVIKNNPDPSVDHAAARMEEAAFFKGYEPWATMLSDHNGRFGTLPLQTALSQLLTDRIRKSLPRITAQVQQKAEIINSALKELPEPLHGNLPAIVLGELMKFERELQKNMDGGLGVHVLQKEWNKKAVQFRKTLADTKPIMKLRDQQQCNMRDTPLGGTLGTPTPTSRTTATIAIESDDDDLPNNHSPIQLSAHKRPHPSTQSTPVKSRRSQNATPRSVPVLPKVQSKVFELAEVQSLIQDAYPGGIPDLIHPLATEQMVILSMAHWQEPLDQFLKETQELCETMVFEQVEAVFGHRQHTRYFDLILEICQTFFGEAFSQQRQLLNRVLAWETSKPTTLNAEAMGMARDKALAMLQAHSREIRARQYVEEQEAKIGKATSGAALKEKAAKVADGQLKPDLHGRELLAMSIVKGFYDVAYSRFVDIVCASIHCELFGKLRNELFPAMTHKFGVTEPGANERFAILLAANARDEERRAVLMKEKETIEKAQQRLEGLS
ncbi:MAG: hypothetical protein Q9217_006038 [Psora testacea]